MRSRGHPDMDPRTRRQVTLAVLIGLVVLLVVLGTRP